MTEPSERWLPVTGYEGIYEVSDLGRVRSLDRVRNDGGNVRGRMLKPIRRTRGGYLHVSLHAGGARDAKRIHRLVLEAFAGPPPGGMETRHMDGDPTNNALVNLRWGTGAENTQDTLRHGTHQNAHKTHCPRGHEYTPENTYQTSSRGWRGCRECRRLRRSTRLIGARS